MAIFCQSCGGRLLRPDAAFCQICGRPVAEEGPQTEPAPQGQAGRDSTSLQIEEPGRPSRTIHLEKDTIAVGRGPQNDIVLHNGAVSRGHLRLTRRGGAYWAEDLGSTNGTLINGRRLEQERQLHGGDIIRIGDPQGNSVSLTLQGATAGGAPPHPHQGTIRLDRLDLEQARYSIGRDKANDIQLDHPTVSRRHAQIEQAIQGAVIRDLGSQNGTFVNGQPVRRSHPLAEGDTIQIGPFKLVYGRGGTTLLNPAGNYRIDAVGLRRVVTIGSPLSPATLLGQNGGPVQKEILKDISLSVYPREFIALVGGSGAGKSTLMKALSGFAPAEGRVFVNGDDLYTNFAAYRSILGYVPQDDIIHGLLTVRSALTYSARLRLPDASPQEIERRIDKVLDQVDMLEHDGKQINRLSGGQRKRVSIAVELLAEPGLFFLDEPTSGLDPGLEKKMMYTLRRLADDGRTIVLVTHATANITQCTHVTFLAEGHMTYFGPPEEALDYFGVREFADIYTRLTQPVSAYTGFEQTYPGYTPGGNNEHPADGWATRFRQSAAYERHVRARGPQAQPPRGQAGAYAASRSGQNISAVQQFTVLARRYLDLLRRDTLSLFILLAVMPIIGLLLLIMTGEHDLVGKPPDVIQNELQQEIDDLVAAEDAAVDDEQFSASYAVANATQRLLFMMALAANLLGLFAAAYEIIKEQAIYRRERMINLQILPYLLSKIAVLAVFAALQVLFFLIVLGFKLEYPDQGVFLPPLLEMYVTLFLATLASVAMGLFISAAVKNRDTVIYVILIVIFIQIIFAGAIFDLPSAARPISYLTTSRWTLEALGSTVDMEALNEEGVTCVTFEEQQMQRMLGDPDAPCEEGQMQQAAAVSFNVTYRAETDALLGRWLVLVLFGLLFGAGTFRLQQRKDVL